MLSRRSAMLSALAACVTAPHRCWAQSAPAAAGEEAGPVTILRVQRRSIEVNGKPASVLSIRQPDDTPGLITEVGKQFQVRDDNELNVPTLIHWHGLTPPWQQDGVPGVSGPPIPPVSAPNTTSHCASGVHSGCIRIKASKNRNSSQRPSSFATGVTGRINRKW